MALTASDGKCSKGSCEARIPNRRCKAQLGRIEENQDQRKGCTNREYRSIQFGQACCNHINILEVLHFVSMPTHAHTGPKPQTRYVKAKLCPRNLVDLLTLH